MRIRHTVINVNGKCICVTVFKCPDDIPFLTPELVGLQYVTLFCALHS